MKLNKKKLFELHSWIGTKLSILFFIVCFSGTLATLSSEMDWLFNSEIRATPQQQLASRNLIVSNFKQHYPNAIISEWSRHKAPYLCDIITKEENGEDSYVFANPYTGRIQGETAFTVKNYFRTLHYYLFIPLHIGHYTVLFFGFLLFVSLATALMFYKTWWKKLFELKTGKGPLVFFRSLHRLIGLWTVPFTLLFSITGLWYFIERTNIGGIGDAADAEAPVKENVTDEVAFDKSSSLTIDYDKAVAIAQRQIPNLTVGDIAPPKRAANYLYLTGISDVGLVRERANRVYLDPVTFEVGAIQNARQIDTITWINDSVDPLHFGTWGGLTTKLIWFLIGMGICSLILSGIWIMLKRKASKRKEKKETVMGIWKYINLSVNGVVLFFMYKTVVTVGASTQAIVFITLGWLLFIAIGYYIFVYKLNKVVALKK